MHDTLLRYKRIDQIFEYRKEYNFGLKLKDKALGKLRRMNELDQEENTAQFLNR